MSERFFANVQINLVGFGIVACLNLLLIGLIVRGWGLEAYGIFVVFRVLTPLGFFNVLDFGILESTVRNVARYRSFGHEIGQVGMFSFLFVLFVGGALSLALVVSGVICSIFLI